MGVSAFWMCAAYGRLNVMKILAKKGCKTEVVVKSGANPVYVAAKNGHLIVLKYLIQLGVSILPKNNGLTPLGIAAYNSHLGCVKFLLENGSSIKNENFKFGALYLACRKENIQIVNYFLNHEAIKEQLKENNSPIELVIKSQNIKLLNLFVQHNIDFNSCKNVFTGKFTLFDLAMRTNNYEILEKYGNMNNLEEENEFGYSPFQEMCVSGNFETAKFLLRNGADPNYINSNGENLIQILNLNPEIKNSKDYNQKFRTFLLQNSVIISSHLKKFDNSHFPNEKRLKRNLRSISSFSKYQNNRMRIQNAKKSKDINFVAISQNKNNQLKKLEDLQINRRGGLKCLRLNSFLFEDTIDLKEYTKLETELTEKEKKENLESPSKKHPELGEKSIEFSEIPFLPKAKSSETDDSTRIFPISKHKQEAHVEPVSKSLNELNKLMELNLNLEKENTRNQQPLLLRSSTNDDYSDLNLNHPKLIKSYSAVSTKFIPNSNLNSERDSDLTHSNSLSSNRPSSKKIRKINLDNLRKLIYQKNIKNFQNLKGFNKANFYGKSDQLRGRNCGGSRNYSSIPKLSYFDSQLSASNSEKILFPNDYSNMHSSQDYSDSIFPNINNFSLNIMNNIEIGKHQMNSKNSVINIETLLKSQNVDSSFHYRNQSVRELNSEAEDEKIISQEELKKNVEIAQLSQLLKLKKLKELKSELGKKCRSKSNVNYSSELAHFQKKIIHNSSRNISQNSISHVKSMNSLKSMNSINSSNNESNLESQRVLDNTNHRSRNLSQRGFRSQRNPNSQSQRKAKNLIHKITNKFDSLKSNTKTNFRFIHLKKPSNLSPINSRRIKPLYYPTNS